MVSRESRADSSSCRTVRVMNASSDNMAMSQCCIQNQTLLCQRSAIPFCVFRDRNARNEQVNVRLGSAECQHGNAYKVADEMNSS